MTSVIAFLAVVFVAGAVVGAVVMGLTVAAGRVLPRSPRSDEVLPAQYSSLVNANPSNYPGYCPECGTNNDPEYTVCRDCSSRLPKSRYERSKPSTNAIFEREQ
ncbi:MAG: hypothetical protein ABEJ26_04220 [Halosimplex sp.]